MNATQIGRTAQSKQLYCLRSAIGLNFIWQHWLKYVTVPIWSYHTPFCWFQLILCWHLLATMVAMVTNHNCLLCRFFDSDANLTLCLSRKKNSTHHMYVCCGACVAAEPGLDSHLRCLICFQFKPLVGVSWIAFFPEFGYHLWKHVRFVG